MKNNININAYKDYSAIEAKTKYISSVLIKMDANDLHNIENSYPNDDMRTIAVYIAFHSDRNYGYFPAGFLHLYAYPNCDAAFITFGVIQEYRRSGILNQLMRTVFVDVLTNMHHMIKNIVMKVPTGTVDITNICIKYGFHCTHINENETFYVKTIKDSPAYKDQSSYDFISKLDEFYEYTKKSYEDFLSAVNHDINHKCDICRFNMDGICITDHCSINNSGDKDLFQWRGPIPDVNIDPQNQN